MNKAMGKIAISRVHTSVKYNVVPSCFAASPDEMLAKKGKWQHISDKWPIAKAQKVENWLPLVAHRVPTSTLISDFKEEVENFN